MMHVCYICGYSDTRAKDLNAAACAARCMLSVMFGISDTCHVLHAEHRLHLKDITYPSLVATYKLSQTCGVVTCYCLQVQE